MVVPRPPSRASAYERNTWRLTAKSGLRATSSMPPCPAAEASGTPSSGALTVPSVSTHTTGPGRRVMSMLPSGRMAMPQGRCRPPAISWTANAVAVDGCGARVWSSNAGVWPVALGGCPSWTLGRRFGSFGGGVASASVAEAASASPAAVASGCPTGAVVASGPSEHPAARTARQANVRISWVIARRVLVSM